MDLTGNRLPLITALAALAYGALRAYWLLAGATPAAGPMRTDLILLTGWWPTALCLAAAGIAIGLWTARDRPVPALTAAAALVTGVLLVIDALVLLDVVSLLTAAGALAFHPASAASRAACLGVAALLAASAVVQRRRARDACTRCGRTAASRPTDRVPRWAVAGAYVAVLGCAVRLAAQFAVGGFDATPLGAGASMIVFEVGFILAGTLLPLALAHRFGRIWPRWVPVLAGRRVPRWLVLGPGATFSIGLVVYFGIGLGQLVAGAVTGAGGSSGTYPPAFMWTAILAYWAWGWGMGAAAYAYLQVTRPPCRACGEGRTTAPTAAPPAPLPAGR